MPVNQRYGYFDNKAREFVITRPDTPTPWINYLGCQDYLGIISNTAGNIIGVFKPGSVVDVEVRLG
ncbi:MAG: hypothetical protein ABSG97_04855 [Sedimentisphaerales bacterium]|jgi:cellobiose phosphorylase